MTNFEKNMTDDPVIKEIKVIERYENGLPKLYYFLMKMPGMSMREALCAFERHDLEDGRNIFIFTSTEHPDYPVTNKLIRLDLYTAGHCFTEGENCRYQEFAYFDMKGWFPTRLMNIMIGTMAT